MTDQLRNHLIQIIIRCATVLDSVKYPVVAIGEPTWFGINVCLTFTESHNAECVCFIALPEHDTEAANAIWTQTPTCCGVCTGFGRDTWCKNNSTNTSATFNLCFTVGWPHSDQQDADEPAVEPHKSGLQNQHRHICCMHAQADGHIWVLAY